MKVSSSGRLLELLSLLQARPRWTAEELAERMQVTTRTVRRDVTRLRDLGYPVEADPGPLGGYQLGSGGALPPLLLSDDEAVAVAIGLRIAATGGMGGPEDAAIAALAKLEQVLPSRLREQVRSLTGTTVILGSRRGPNPVIDPDVLLTLAQGCRNNERLHFVYTDRSERVTERRVEPFRLVSTQNRRWYLVAFDLDRDDWRTFRVDRLTEAQLTGHRFPRTGDEPDAAALVSEGIAVTAYAWQAEVLLHIDYERASQEVGALAGRIEPAEGGTLLRLGADTLEWIARYLAGLPFEFEIISPPELRKTVRAVARRLLNVPAVASSPGPSG